MSDKIQTITPDASSPLEQIENTSWSTLLDPSPKRDTLDDDDASPSINREDEDEEEWTEDEPELDDEVFSEDDSEDEDIDEEDEADAKVPFHQHPRWKEVLGERNVLRQELAEARAWDPIVEELRSQGFETPEEVQQAVQQQRAQAEQTAFEEARAAEVAQHLNSEVQAGRIDPEYAQQLYHHQMQLERQQHELNEAVARIRSSEAAMEIANAQRQFPGMDPEYVWTMHQTTGLPISHIAEISSARSAALRQQAVSEYIAQQARLEHIPTPEGKGGVSPSPKKANDPWKLPSFSVLMGMAKGRE